MIVQGVLSHIGIKSNQAAGITFTLIFSNLMPYLSL